MSAVEPVGVWRRVPDVVHRTLAGMSIVKRLADGEALVLRSTASLIWLGLESPASVDELAIKLRSIEVRVSEAEIERGLVELANVGLVRADG